MYTKSLLLSISHISPSRSHMTWQLKNVRIRCADGAHSQNNTEDWQSSRHDLALTALPSGQTGSAADMTQVCAVFCSETQPLLWYLKISIVSEWITCASMIWCPIYLCIQKFINAKCKDLHFWIEINFYTNLINIYAFYAYWIYLLLL